MRSYQMNIRYLKHHVTILSFRYIIIKTWLLSVSFDQKQHVYYFIWCFIKPKPNRILLLNWFNRVSILRMANCEIMIELNVNHVVTRKKSRKKLISDFKITKVWSTLFESNKTTTTPLHVTCACPHLGLVATELALYPFYCFDLYII